MAGSPLNLHRMFPGRACIHAVLKVKVKGHVMQAYCHQTYILPTFTIPVASSELIYRPIGSGTTPYATGRGGRLRFTPSVAQWIVAVTDKQWVW